MLTWHNDHDLKAEVLARMIEHRREDSIVQKVYQVVDPELASGFRGCLIGCTLPLQGDKSSVYTDETVLHTWHMKVSEVYGLPTWVGRWLDTLFENIPAEDAAAFAVDSIEAIPVGVDLDLVRPAWEQELADYAILDAHLAERFLKILASAPHGPSA